MKKITKVLVAGALGLFPVLAFAQNTQNLFDLVSVAERLVGAIVPFIIGLAVLVIVWGLFNYIAGAGDEEKRAQAKQYIIWGIIGLFVMVSVWGLVGVLSKTVNLDTFTATSPQVVPGNSGTATLVNPPTQCSKSGGGIGSLYTDGSCR